MLPPYTKPHLSFSDQLQLLIQRGLEVTDLEKAILHLERIGYGRLTPYARVFQERVVDPGNNARTIPVDRFKPGSAFRHAVDLYLFDKQLRLLLLDAIERIEVALRVSLSHALGKRDPWAHLSINYLDNHRAEAIERYSGLTRHQAWLEKARAATDRSREEWVTDFRSSYSSPLPIWMAVETWDYGTLSQLLEMAHSRDRAAIAGCYGLLPNTLVSWTKTLSYVRNICAHHARIWNTGIIKQPMVPKISEVPNLTHIGRKDVHRNRVYGAIAVAGYFVERISPGTTWKCRMRDHWTAFPEMPFASPAQAGFLPGWETEEFWT